MSVNSYLTDLASALVLSSGENSSISTSIATLSARLSLYFGSDIDSDFKFGSSTRGTILPRQADERSDIDYMVVFENGSPEFRPQTYLNRLKNFAQARYSTSEINQSHPTIVLSLNHIKFELVPALEDYWAGYKIPSPASDWSDWMNTNPNGFNTKLSDANGNNNFKIKPLVRLIKYWNAKNGYPFRSFELEDYICNQVFWGCSSLKDYFYHFWEYFSWPYSLSLLTQGRIGTVQRRIETAKANEAAGYPYTAQQEIEKIVPSF